MKSPTRSGVFFVTIALLILLAGCRPAARSEHQLKLGVMAGAEEQVAEIAKKVAKERYSLDVELVVFSDYIAPNAALGDGSIDANAFQHRPYLEQQIKDRGYRIVAVGNTFVYPIAGYSRRIKTLAELLERAQVAVPNDPTNLGRSLALLEREKLIGLRPGAGINGTVLDIQSNPKQLRIVELDAAQLPRVLPDVDLAIINTNYASQIGLSPAKDGLFVEDKDSPYVNLIVAREDNRDAEKVKTFVKAYQSEEVFAAAQGIFKGGVVKGW
jgi:D-methionine transport system substrate-binding protein